MSSKELGNKIRARRNILGLTLEELSRKTGVSKAYLSQIENSESLRPSAEVLYDIATILELSVADLLGKSLYAAGDRVGASRSFEQAAVEFQWNDNEVKNMLSAIAFRSGPETKSFKPDDWNYLYETLRRVRRVRSK